MLAAQPPGAIRKSSVATSSPGVREPLERRHEESATSDPRAENGSPRGSPVSDDGRALDPGVGEDVELVPALDENSESRSRRRSPAWNQCRVSGGIRNWSPGSSTVSCQTVKTTVRLRPEPPGSASARPRCRGRRSRCGSGTSPPCRASLERRMPVLGAGLAREEHELLRADPFGVQVDDDLEPGSSRFARARSRRSRSTSAPRESARCRRRRGSRGSPAGCIDLWLRQHRTDGNASAPEPSRPATGRVFSLPAPVRAVRGAPPIRPMETK